MAIVGKAKLCRAGLNNICLCEVAFLHAVLTDFSATISFFS